METLLPMVLLLTWRIALKGIPSIPLLSLTVRALHIVCVRNEFAYSSTDKLVYIRKFAKTGSEMKMVAVLQGHEGDVTQVL